MEQVRDKRLEIMPGYRKLLWRLLYLLFIPLGFLLPSIFTLMPRFCEWYMLHVYPIVHSVIAFIPSLVPFSVAEFILYALLIGVPAFLIFRTTQLIIKKIPLHAFLSNILTLFTIFGIALCAFYFVWGISYSRYSLDVRMGLNVEPRDKQELIDLTEELAIKANLLRDDLIEDENGVFVFDSVENLDSSVPSEPNQPTKGEYSDAFQMVSSAYDALELTWPELCPATFVTPKFVIASEAMSYGGIAGIYIPYTGEANVNIDQPPLLIGASGAHEAAHAMGIARENEAEFMAYLVCSDPSNTLSLQYSGTMLALIHCTNQLYKIDPDAYIAIATEHYSDGMLRDLADYNAYWESFEGPVEEAVTTMNDNYLQHNGLDSGVQSYGEVVDLLLAYHDA